MRLLLTVLGLLALNAVGATYYIAPSGGSDSNPGTEAQPWANWTKVASTVANGDTVIARGGVWTGQKYFLINGKTNLTIQAYPGETPILTTNYWVPAASATPSLWVVNSSNILIQGITVTNNSKNVLIQATDCVTLQDCIIGWSLTTNNSVNFGIATSRFLTLTNCTINHVGQVTPDNNDEGETFKSGAQTDTAETVNYGHRFLNCTFIHGGHTLPEVASRNTVFRDCVFYNDDFFVGTNGVSTFGNRWLSFLGGNAMSNLVEDCRFGYSGRPSDQPEGCAGIEISTSRNILRRNSLYRARGTAFSLYQKGFGQQPTGNYIYHNSILNAGYDTNATYYWRVSFGLFHENDCTNNVFLNNVTWANPTNVWYFREGATLSNRQARIAFNLDNTSDPLFVNTNMPGESSVDLPNLNLSSGSPAINAGGWLTTVSSESGSGTSVTVADAGFFYDGWGIAGEVGDVVQLQGGTATARITAVDYAANTLTLNSSLTWTNGQGVSLPYSGTAPDQGAYEYQQVNRKATLRGSFSLGGKYNAN